MVLVAFRLALREGADLAELERLNERMSALVGENPGFRGMKEYQAADGELLTLVEFDSLEAVAAWRDHPEHRAAQQRGREEFFAHYRLQVCTVVRDYGVPAS